MENQIKEITNNLLEKELNSISDIETKMQNLVKEQENIIKNTRKARELLQPTMDVLKKMGLDITEYRIYNGIDEKTRISVRAVSDGEFKFYVFRGYTSQGRDFQQNQMSNKADKMSEKIKKAINCEGVRINPYSLQIKSSDSCGCVLIDIVG